MAYAFIMYYAFFIYIYVIYVHTVFEACTLRVQHPFNIPGYCEHNTHQRLLINILFYDHYFFMTACRVKTKSRISKHRLGGRCSCNRFFSGRVNPNNILSSETPVCRILKHYLTATVFACSLSTESVDEYVQSFTLLRCTVMTCV